jgi:hypothetical protein
MDISKSNNIWEDLCKLNSKANFYVEPKITKLLFNDILVFSNAEKKLEIFIIYNTQRRNNCVFRFSKIGFQRNSHGNLINQRFIQKIFNILDEHFKKPKLIL